VKIEIALNWDGLSTPTWTDYSDSIDLSGLKVTKKLNENNDPQKNITGDIEAYSAAYLEIKANLIDSANRYSNFYVVRITEPVCGTVEYFKIEDRSLKWCDNGECSIILTITEYIVEFDCIKKKLIADNTNFIFSDFPLPGMIHPRFRYCDVFKPTWAYGFVIAFINLVTITIAAINIVLTILTGWVVWILSIFGVSANVPQIGFSFLEDVIGCGLAHPSPFIRTYIDNVCDQCGVSVTNSSIPILYDEASPYYNLAMMYAPTKKGVPISGTKDYIRDNQPTWSLFDLLSKIKDVFNARWLMRGQVIYFAPKDEISDVIYGAGNYGIDLTGDDSNYLDGDVCYTYNGQGKPTKLLIKYGQDFSDNIGNELASRFNCTWEDLTGGENYNEVVTRSLSEFGTVAAVFDGQDGKYDANIESAFLGPITGTEYEGSIKTQGDTFGLPKLVIYDPTSEMSDARMVKAQYILYNSVGADIPAMRDDDPFATVFASSYWNYPMSFDQYANGVSGNMNLWEYHVQDTATPTKRTNISAEFKMQYCCRFITVDLFHRVLHQDGVTVSEIYEIEMDYGRQLITIKTNLV